MRVMPVTTSAASSSMTAMVPVFDSPTASGRAVTVMRHCSKGGAIERSTSALASERRASSSRSESMLTGVADVSANAGTRW